MSDMSKVWVYRLTMQPVCKKVVVHDFLYDKIEEVGLKSKLTLRQGGGGKNLGVNLTLSVQRVGTDGFPYMHILFVKAGLIEATPSAGVDLPLKS